jgi:hypothetical protein
LILKLVEYLMQYALCTYDNTSAHQQAPFV